MNQRDMGAVYARCPFYLSDYKNSITCEGMTPGTRTRTVFDMPKAKTAWLKNHCFYDPRETQCWYCKLKLEKE